MPAIVPPNVEILKSYLLGTLSEEQSAQVERFLAQSPGSAALLQAVQAEDGLTAALRAQRGRPRFQNPLLEKVRGQLRQVKVPSLADCSMPTNPSLSASLTPSGKVPEGSLLTLREPAAPPPPFLGPAQAPDELGRLGNYRVLRELGAGGMGQVYQAEDITLKRLVALKVMRPSLAADPHARDRFLREARATAQLQHDHIVPIYHVGEEKGVPFLAMPLLQGETLEDRLRRFPTLPLGEVLRIGRETALGLSAAHERGIIHRDIKPGNLWVEAPSGRIKVLDFGLAWMEAPEGEKTATGAILDTPGYMAPEQMDGDADARSDIFSLGCVLYRMACGQLPFKGQTPMQRLRSLLSDTPAPIQQLNPNLPAPVAAFLMRMLSKKREDRPVSATVTARVLGTLLEQAPVVATPPVAIPVTPEVTAVSRPGQPVPPVAIPVAAETVLLPSASPRRPLWRHPGVLAAAAAVLLLGLLFRGKKPDTGTERGKETAQAGTGPGKGDLTDTGQRPVRRRPVIDEPLPSGPAGEAFSPTAWVSRPTPIDGLLGWSVESDLARDFDRVKFQPDGRLFISSASQGARMLNLETVQVDAAPFGGSFRDVTPDGVTCVVLSRGGTPQLLDRGDDRPRVTLFGGGEKVAFSPGGKLLATSSPAVTIFWDVKTGLKVRSVEHNLNIVETGVWSPDGKSYALPSSPSAGWEQIRLLDVNEGKVHRSIPIAPSYNPACLCWSPESDRLAVVTQTGRLLLFEPDTGRVASESRDGLALYHVTPAWSPDGKQIALAAAGGKQVVLWNVAEAKEVRRFGVGGINRVLFDSDGQTLVTTDSTNTLRFWNPDNGLYRASLVVLTNWDGWVAFSPEGHYKGGPGVEGRLTYKARNKDGVRDYSAKDFAARFSWKNQPEQVHLLPRSSPAKE